MVISGTFSSLTEMNLTVIVFLTQGISIYFTRNTALACDGVLILQPVRTASTEEGQLGLMRVPGENN